MELGCWRIASEVEYTVASVSPIRDYGNMINTRASVGNLTIRQLEIFLIASRSDNFSSAAKKLGIAQSTLSSAISRIENLLGVTVFDRSTRRVALTAEGGRLVAAADLLVYTYNTAIRNLRNENLSAFKVRIAFTEALSGAVAPAAVSRFRQLQENWEVVVHDVDAELAIKLVRDGSVDFSIVSNLPPLPGLKMETIGETRLDVVASPAWKLATRRAVTWEVLAGLPLILAGSLKRRGYLQAMWTGVGLDLRAAYEVNDVSTAIGFAAQGLGYLLLPHSYLPRPLDPRLVAVRLNEDSMRWPLQLIYPEDRTLSEPQRQLVACLQDDLSAIP